jgi:hypothetical protein
VYTPFSEEQASYRQWLRTFVKEEKLLLDSFREIHPEATQAYTAWNTYLNSRPANQGCRIDYILLSPDLGPPILKSASILSDIHGSDHCPISCELLFPSNEQSSSVLEYGPSLWIHHNAHKPLVHYFEKNSKRNSSKALLDSLPSELASQTTNIGTPSASSAKGKKKAKKQVTLDAFFGLPAKGKLSHDSDIARTSTSEPLNINSPPKSFEDFKKASAPISLDPEHMQAWSTIFRPKPVPLCFHGEAAKAFTTKAKGPNTGRVFFACSKPGLSVSAGQIGGEIAKTDEKKAPVTSEERCKFFQWKNSSSLVKKAK